MVALFLFLHAQRENKLLGPHLLEKVPQFLILWSNLSNFFFYFLIAL